MGNTEHTNLQTNRKAKSKESASHINATLMNYIQQFPFQQSSIYHLNYSAPFCKKKHKIITTFTIYIYIYILNTKESKNHTLKKSVGVWVSNLRADNDTWSQLSILYKIKTKSKLIKEKNKEQK